MPPTPPQPDPMAAALARLWTKFLPEIQSRVAILAAAAAALQNGQLADDQRRAAHAAAHKLAGSLGTFGLHQGTHIARLAEDALTLDPPAASPAELNAWVAELQSILPLANPPSPASGPPES